MEDDPEPYMAFAARVECFAAVIGTRLENPCNLQFCVALFPPRLCQVCHLGVDRNWAVICETSLLCLFDFFCAQS